MIDRLNVLTTSTRNPPNGQLIVTGLLAMMIGLSGSPAQLSLAAQERLQDRQESGEEPPIAAPDDDLARAFGRIKRDDIEERIEQFERRITVVRQRSADEQGDDQASAERDRLRESVEVYRRYLAGIDRIAELKRLGDEASVLAAQSKLYGLRLAVHIQKARDEHHAQLVETVELREAAVGRGDSEVEQELAEIIALHEQVLENLRQVYQGLLEEKFDSESEELLSDAFRISDLLELRHAITERGRELRATEAAGDIELAKELRQELKMQRVRAGLEELDGPVGGAEPIEISREEMLAAANVSFEQEIMPLMNSHCVDCHGPDTSEGELDLVRLASIRPFVKRRDTWQKVIAHVSTRVMPPEDDGEMEDEVRMRLAAYLKWAIEEFDYSQVNNPGYEATRRLTHAEYDNTVRDLFGIDIEVATRFPMDLSGTSGFANSGNTLFLHRLLMERYFGAAERIVEVALPAEPQTAFERETYERIFGSRLDDEIEPSPTAAESILSRFLLRAFRRPPTRAELASSLRQFQESRAGGNGFHDAIRHTIQTALVSPSFLMRIEPWQSGDRPYAISDWDLASRLSYFLWASMPDDELLTAAAAGRLRDSDTIHAQVDRMLSDRRAFSLGSIFAGQWLGSQHLGVRYRPDPIDNPWCTDTLMDSMKMETSLFISALVVENRPISELLNADYTYLNEELAEHYGIDGVVGSEMRRVTLSDPNRGGILGHGSVLAMTSFPGRTSPVVRGKWVLSDLLGTPPPPPPPNVSDFDDEVADNRFLTQRQKLALHRQNPTCYACHSEIDPLGLSLERFDWFGRTRSDTPERKLDTGGKLPGGTEFDGPAGLKQVLVEQRLPDLRRQLTRKMLSYALGRQLEYYDEPAVRKIIERTVGDNDRIQSLIHAIVDSYPFRYKQNPDEENGD